MRKDRYSKARLPENISLKMEAEPLLLEVEGVAADADQKSKDEAFAFALGALTEETLNRMLGSAASRGKRDGAAEATFVRLAVFLRGHLHGNASGGFKGSREEMEDILHTLQPYLVTELMRRRGCFEFFDLPASLRPEGTRKMEARVF